MKKKIEELFRLAMKAQEKTSAFVSFETSNHGWGCVVMIMDDILNRIIEGHMLKSGRHLRQEKTFR